MALKGYQLVNWKKAIVRELRDIARKAVALREREAALEADLRTVEARIAEEGGSR